MTDPAPSDQTNDPVSKGPSPLQISKPEAPANLGTTTTEKHPSSAPAWRTSFPNWPPNSPSTRGAFPQNKHGRFNRQHQRLPSISEDPTTDFAVDKLRRQVDEIQTHFSADDVCLHDGQPCAQKINWIARRGSELLESGGDLAGSHDFRDEHHDRVSKMLSKMEMAAAQLAKRCLDAHGESRGEEAELIARRVGCFAMVARTRWMNDSGNGILGLGSTTSWKEFREMAVEKIEGLEKCEGREEKKRGSEA